MKFNESTLILFLCALFCSNSFKQIVSDQEMLKHGKKVYEMRCIGCHGEKGNGKGLAAPFLDPKPRDFTSGVFKFKSTPNEALPSDHDLMRVLSLGVLGTSMPNFKLMSEVSRYSVAQYIKTFSDVWKKQDNFQPKVQGAPFPREDFTDYEKFMARAKKGRGLYLENCLVCHGREGLGNGEGAVGLEDDWGFPIKPARFDKKYIKSGHSVEDIYRVLLSGLAGSPMLAYKDVLTDQQLWDVSAYVFYLRGFHNGLYDQANPPIKPISKEEASEY